MHSLAGLWSSFVLRSMEQPDAKIAAALDDKNVLAPIEAALRSPYRFVCAVADLTPGRLGLSHDLDCVPAPSELHLQAYETLAGWASSTPARGQVARSSETVVQALVNLFAHEYALLRSAAADCWSRSCVPLHVHRHLTGDPVSHRAQSLFQIAAPRAADAGAQQGREHVPVPRRRQRRGRPGPEGPRPLPRRRLVRPFACLCMSCRSPC